MKPRSNPPPGAPGAPGGPGGPGGPCRRRRVKKKCGLVSSLVMCCFYQNVTLKNPRYKGTTWHNLSKQLNVKKVSLLDLQQVPSLQNVHEVQEVQWVQADHSYHPYQQHQQLLKDPTNTRKFQMSVSENKLGKAETTQLLQTKLTYSRSSGSSSTSGSRLSRRSLWVHKRRQSV